MKFFQNLVAKLAGKAIDKTLKLEDGNMSGGKKWYRSKIIWSGIITIIIGAYETARLNLAPQFGWNLPDIPPIVFTLLGAAGVYWRTQSTEKIIK